MFENFKWCLRYLNDQPNLHQELAIFFSRYVINDNPNKHQELPINCRAS